MTPAFLSLRPAAPGGGGLPGPGAAHTELNLSLLCQEEEQWCWSAVTQAVEDWHGASVSQSEIASNHIAPTGGLVCATPLGAPDGSQCTACHEGCGGAHILSAVLRERGRLAAPPSKIPPTFADVRTAISADRPLPVRIDWGASTNNAGHFVCVIGYTVDGAGRQWVTVFDPLSPGLRAGAADPIVMAFDELVGVGTYAAASGSGGTLNFTYEVQ